MDHRSPVGTQRWLGGYGHNEDGQVGPKPGILNLLININHQHGGVTYKSYFVI